MYVRDYFAVCCICLYMVNNIVNVLCSGMHEKPVLEAGILEKLIDVVIEMAEKDEDNVSVIAYR